jgi:tetratricopeptide (TPR) repeat protein
MYLACVSVGMNADETEMKGGATIFQSAQDLEYGRVLYEYHQGNHFEALSALNVAKLRSGIQGHGEHPELVEGGLMLSYGLIDDAKAIFDSLLRKQISRSDRNQAWYYLGKVFFLVEDDPLAIESFAKIEEELLKKENPSLYHELLYMKGQVILRDHDLGLKQKQSELSTLLLGFPEDNIWRHYLHYNTIMNSLAAVVDVDPAVQQAAIDDLLKLSNILMDNRDEERLNLKEQCLLSLGQLYLQQGDNQSAFDVLKQIRKESLLSDQALFAYAVASTNLGQYGLALEALTKLRGRPQFTPWVQQVPYALAYLYEQMNDPELALKAYRVAVQHYESMVDELSVSQGSVDEKHILSALNLVRPLGDETLSNDAYGKLDIEPRDFRFSYLLASEPFQRQLSDLHELYKLEHSLQRWSKQLDSFDTMMTTRIALRQEKLQQTNLAMEAQNAELWEEERLLFKRTLERAHDNEDVRFFMNETQIKYAEQIEKAEETLALIPEDNRKRKRYALRLNRVKAYFDWWLSESYSENRWRAFKQMRELDREMASFHKHQGKLIQSMASDGGNDKLARRVEDGKKRLAEIRKELSHSLIVVRTKLLDLVRQDYDRQMDESLIYLQASRESLARLSDQVYHSQLKREHSIEEGQ